MKKFVCYVCGYVYEGEAAPAECPICHAPAEKFKEQAGEYPQLARFQQILAQLGGSQEDESYAVNVELTAVVPQDDCARFEERVREAFNAAVVPAPIDMVNIPVPLA